MVKFKIEKISGYTDFRNKKKVKRFLLFYNGKSICLFNIIKDDIKGKLYSSLLTNCDLSEEKIKKLIDKKIKKIFNKEKTTIMSLRSIKWFKKV
jgi:hypothetical protein